MSLRLAMSQYCPRAPLSDRASACAPRRRRRRVRLSLAGSARARLDGALCLGGTTVRAPGDRPAECDVEDRRPARHVPAARGARPACGAGSGQAGRRDQDAAGGLACRSHRSSTGAATARTQLEPDAAREAAGLTATTACKTRPAAGTTAEPGSASTATAVTSARDPDPATASRDPDPATAAGVRRSAR